MKYEVSVSSKSNVISKLKEKNRNYKSINVSKKKAGKDNVQMFTTNNETDSNYFFELKHIKMHPNKQIN